MNMASLKSFYNDVMITIYCKIPLIGLGRICQQRKKLMGLYSRWGGGAGNAYIREEKHFNFQPVKLTFLSFFQYKARISGIYSEREKLICQVVLRGLYGI